MKELKRGKISETKVQPGDTIILSYSEKFRDVRGKVQEKTEKVLKAKIKEWYSFNEAVIFEVEKGDFKKVKRGLGGAFLESDE